LWGYFGSDNPSVTALIPVMAGSVLLLLAAVMRNASRVAAHIAVILTFILVVALVKPLTAAISRSDPAAVIRVSVMIGTCILALATYIKSFIDARKQRSSLG